MPSKLSDKYPLLKPIILWRIIFICLLVWVIASLLK